MAKRKLDLSKILGFALASSFAATSCQSSPKVEPSGVPPGIDSASVVAPAAIPAPVVPAPANPAPVAPASVLSAPSSGKTMNARSTFDILLSTDRAPDGTILSVILHPLKDVDPDGVKIMFEGKMFPVFKYGPKGDLASLIVVQYDSKPRKTMITVTWHGGIFDIPLEVVDGGYPKTFAKPIKVAKGTDRPSNPAAILRTTREAIEIGKLYRRITPERFWSGPFVLPIESEIISQFGGKRIFNDKNESIHKGLDLRARTPLPIHAPEGAKVVLAKELWFTGNTVILDHGYGLFTVYAHMSKLDVKVGDRVTKGEVLGLSGMTGRASGPHLHWGAVLMSEKFNPANLTQLPR